jgi:hypothetical protein
MRPNVTRKFQANEEGRVVGMTGFLLFLLGGGIRLRPGAGGVTLFLKRTRGASLSSPSKFTPPKRKR